MLTKNQFIGIWAALLFLSLCSLAGERNRDREGIFLTDSQETLLENLLEELGREDLEAAGRRMNRSQEKLAEIFYDVSGGKACRFVPGTNQKPAMLEWELSGTGLVLKGPGLIFYGDITEEGLNGQGVSLKFSGTGRPRYDYAIGIWKNGRLNGQGTIGYHYYEGTGGEEVMKVEKEGIFQNDCLDGPFTYKSTNGDGQESVWTMKADKGILVLNENWEYLEDKMEYRLKSDENQSHVYVMPESIVSQILWINLLVWSPESKTPLQATGHQACSVAEQRGF